MIIARLTGKYKRVYKNKLLAFSLEGLNLNFIEYLNLTIDTKTNPIVAQIVIKSVKAVVPINTIIATVNRTAKFAVRAPLISPFDHITKPADSYSSRYIQFIATK